MYKLVANIHYSAYESHLRILQSSITVVIYQIGIYLAMHYWKCYAHFMDNCNGEASTRS